MEAIFDQYSVAVAGPEYSASYLDPSTGENKTCGAVREDFAHMFRDAATGDLPWTGTITGMFLNSIWYWCTDQVIVQRALAAKNVSHAKGGCVVAAYLKLLPTFLLVIPRMAARYKSISGRSYSKLYPYLCRLRVLWPNEVACSSPEACERICDSPSGCSNISYVLLVLKLLPEGIIITSC